jgi:drug/metabolite transporter (DMT)-like permease
MYWLIVCGVEIAAMGLSLRRGTSLALAAAIASGISVYINSIGVKGADPFAYTIYKNAFAGVLFAASLMFAKNVSGTVDEIKSNAAKMSFIAVFGGAIPFLMFFRGLSMMNGAAGSFIYRFLFVFCAALAAVFLREKLSWKYAAGAAIALLGNYVLLGNGAIGFGLGEALVLGATMLWAVEWTVTKRMLGKISANSIAVARMLGGSAAMVILVVAAGRAQTLLAVDASFLVWSAIVGTSLFAFLSAWYAALEALPLSKATAILALGGPVTTVLSYAFGQSVSAGTAAGMLLVALGAAVAAQHSASGGPAATAAAA